jgi:hypothetical protein
MEHSSIKIPIEWAKFRETFTKFNQAKEYINTKYAAAPWNPIKVNQNIYFFLGSVLFKYNIPTKNIIFSGGVYIFIIFVFFFLFRSKKLHKYIPLFL